jgi:hypothetical protein
MLVKFTKSRNLRMVWRPKHVIFQQDPCLARALHAKSDSPARIQVGGFGCFFSEVVPSHMETKRIDDSKESQPLLNSGETFSPCPNCGLTRVDQSVLPAVEALIQSHEELASVLRSVGRRMLQSEKQEKDLLHRMRLLLKRADKIRHAMKLHEEYREPSRDADDWIENTPLAATPCEEPVGGALVRKNIIKRNRLSRPHALRIVKPRK